MAEYRKDWDSFVFPWTYVYSVQVYRTTKMPPFSLAITSLPAGPTAIEHRRPPAVSEIDSSFAYTLSLIRWAALLKKAVDTNSKKAPARYTKDYDKHVPFKPGFAAGDYEFVKLPRFGM